MTKNFIAYFVSDCACLIFSEAGMLQREPYCHIGAEKRRLSDIIFLVRRVRKIAKSDY
jgi:hypothetical protein